MEEVSIIKQVKAAQQGDKESFCSLVKQYQNQALHTAIFLTGNYYTAQDVVQEAFVQCYFHLQSLRDPAQFKWWFYRILTRTAWQKKQKDGENIPIAEIFPAKEKELAPDTRTFATEQQEKDTLSDYIAQLEEKHRTVLILYYFNDFSVKEIAKILGVLEGTVKSRLHYARQQLKANLLKETMHAEEKERRERKDRKDRKETEAGPLAAGKNG